MRLVLTVEGSHAQVAINWTICKGAIPIPGAKNARQAKEAAGRQQPRCMFIIYLQTALGYRGSDK